MPHADRLARILVILGCWGLSAPHSLAQESASFRIEAGVLNLAGHPEQGSAPASVGYRISLDSLGEATVRIGASSTSFRMDASFGSAYLPPGEVEDLQFLDATTLAWHAERSAGSYNAYRGALTAVAGNGYGTCWQPDVPGETVTDAEPLPAGSGFFYLVAAKNRLDEEGSKGQDGEGVERGGNVCP
jgi:hypothetical protein